MTHLTQKERSYLAHINFSRGQIRMLRGINARWPKDNDLGTLSLAANMQLTSKPYTEEEDRGFLLWPDDLDGAPPFIELVRDYGRRKFVRCIDFAAWAEYEAEALTAEKHETVRDILLAAADEIREGNEEIAGMFLRKVSA